MEIVNFKSLLVSGYCCIQACQDPEERKQQEAFIIGSKNFIFSLGFIVFTALFLQDLGQMNAYYIDQSVLDAELLQKEIHKHSTAQTSVLQLFSHGKPGQLLLDGHWHSTPQIVHWIKNKGLLKNKTHINIYGCNFAQGEKGKAAVAYLETALGVSIAASDDITGKDGDWVLEVGTALHSIRIHAYSANLQDTDGDLVPDSTDLDDDNDGLLDTEECATGLINFTSLNFTGQIVTLTNGQTMSVDGAITAVVSSTANGDATGNLRLTDASNALPNPPDYSVGDSYQLDFLSPIHINISNATTGIAGFDGDWAGGDEWRVTATGGFHISDPDGQLSIQSIGADFVEFRPVLGTYIAPGNGTWSIVSIDPVSSCTLQASGNPASAVNVSISCGDTDRDGTPDYLDLDSDNDGCYDVTEAGFTDDNNDGILGPNPVNVDGDGLVTSGSDGYTGTDPLVTDNTIVPPGCGLDNDSDGVTDIADLDDDNDGLLDTEECQNFSPMQFSGLSSTEQSYTVGGTLITQSATGFVDLDDTDNSGNLALRDDGNTLSITASSPSTFIFSGATNVGVNFDGVDQWTLSSAGALFVVSDPSNELVLYSHPLGSITFGPNVANGMNWSISVYDITALDIIMDVGNARSDMNVSVTVPCPDTDGDGTTNDLDLDSDNDGIPDITEAGGTDSDGDGIVDDLTDTDSDGLANTHDTDHGGTTIGSLDTDSDGTPDRLDLDSDNDGINDSTEAGVADTNNDGLVDSFTDADGDGFTDSLDPNDNTVAGTGDGTGTPVVPADTDSDGTADFRDLDSDDDGVLDIDESGNSTADSDNNGVADGADTDGDGIPDSVDNNVNTFGDAGDAGTGDDASVPTDPNSGGTGVVSDSGTDADGDGIADSVDTDDTVFGMGACGSANITYAITDGSTNTTNYLWDSSATPAADVPSVATFGTTRVDQYCESEGWRHYYNTNESEKILFSVEMGSNTTELDYIEIRVAENAESRYDTTATNAIFVLKRDWFVQTVGGAALTAPVNIRFYYPASELQSMLDGAIALANADPAATAPTASDIIWFKKGTFDPATDITADAAALESGTGFAMMSPEVVADSQGRSASDDSVFGNNVNYIQFNGITGFSGGTAYVKLNGAALPVELSTFTAKVEGCSIDLNWTTASEVGFAYFDLERGGDARPFESITKIAGRGGDFVANYAYKDRSADDLNYYRLKMVDHDGSIRYSEVITVETACPRHSLKLYPNPVPKQAELHIEFYTDRDEAQIQITDFLGQVVRQVRIDTTPNHKNFLEMSLQGLPSGNYTLRILGSRSLEKFIITE